MVPEQSKPIAINRAMRRRKFRDHTKTQNTARKRPDQEAADRLARIKSTEQGERERIQLKHEKLSKSQ
jgi:hypothetical protein